MTLYSEYDRRKQNIIFKKETIIFFLTLFFSLRNANKIDSEFSVAYFVLSFALKA